MTSDPTTFPSKTRPSPRIPKKRPSRAFWIKTLAEFSKSGLSAQDFCRFKNFSPSNFYAWRKRLREEESNEPLAPATFIPLEVMPAGPSSDPSKESPQNQQAPFSLDVERRCRNSGLSLQLSSSLKISIDREFHEPTLQRLVHLFSSGNSSAC